MVNERGGVFQMYENLLQVLVYRRIVARVCTIHKKTIKAGSLSKKYINQS